ncbi:hypothetical protein IG631_22096, partial [Alternaria alternata]
CPAETVCNTKSALPINQDQVGPTDGPCQDVQTEARTEASIRDWCLRQDATTAKLIAAGILPLYGRGRDSQARTEAESYDDIGSTRETGTNKSQDRFRRLTPLSRRLRLYNRIPFRCLLCQENAPGEKF